MGTALSKQCFPDTNKAATHVKNLLELSIKEVPRLPLRGGAWQSRAEEVPPACVPRPQGYIYNTILEAKAKGSLRKTGAEILKELEKQQVHCEIVSPRNSREATPMRSHQHGCQNMT